MNIEHHLAQQLRILKLGGFLETLDVRLKQAEEEDLSRLEFLQRMVQDEIDWHRGEPSDTLIACLN